MEENQKIQFRFATKADIDLYFNWANDDEVRKNAFQQAKIDYNNHVKWFNHKLIDSSCKMYVFYIDKNSYIGQVRIDEHNHEKIIDISIDKKFRGKKLGSKILKIASEDFFKNNKNSFLIGYIKKENVASLSIFKNANFKQSEELVINNTPVYKLRLESI